MTPFTTIAQAKLKSQIAEDFRGALKVALEEDEWFQTHKSECTMQDSLAWLGAKLYILENQ